MAGSISYTQDRVVVRDWLECDTTAIQPVILFHVLFEGQQQTPNIERITAVTEGHLECFRKCRPTWPLGEVVGVDGRAQTRRHSLKMRQYFRSTTLSSDCFWHRLGL